MGEGFAYVLLIKKKNNGRGEIQTLYVAVGNTRGANWAISWQELFYGVHMWSPIEVRVMWF